MSIRIYWQEIYIKVFCKFIRERKQKHIFVRLNLRKYDHYVKYKKKKLSDILNLIIVLHENYYNIYILYKNL